MDQWSFPQWFPSQPLAPQLEFVSPGVSPGYFSALAIRKRIFICFSANFACNVIKGAMLRDLFVLFFEKG